MASDFDVWTRVGVPMVTFLLGVISAFFIQKYWRRTDEVKAAAKALAELTADWYNQWDALETAIAALPKDADTQPLIDAYVRNRQILPKVLYNLEILQKHHAKPGLVKSVEAFLNVVTEVSWVDQRLYQRRCLQRSAVVKRLLCQHGVNAEMTIGISEHLLRELDERQQEVVKYSVHDRW